MNLPCLLVQMLGGAAGGNLACARFNKCKMGVVADSLLGALGGCLGGQVLMQFFPGDISASELHLFLICMGGGILAGALLTGIVGRIITASTGRRR